ncbi:beta family protein, partial [Klebsiella pneumoniae]|nr:beta family protein [Klebsiella pneumoniae]
MKTRDAELKAMTHLKDDVFDKILPIYELTKSRKTKTTPDGDI